MVFSLLFIRESKEVSVHVNPIKDIGQKNVEDLKIRASWISESNLWDIIIPRPIPHSQATREWGVQSYASYHPCPGGNYSYGRNSE